MWHSSKSGNGTRRLSHIVECDAVLSLYDVLLTDFATSVLAFGAIPSSEYKCHILIKSL